MPRSRAKNGFPYLCRPAHAVWLRLALAQLRRVKPLYRLITSLMPGGASSVYTAAGAPASCCFAGGIVAAQRTYAGLPVAWHPLP